MEKLKDVMDAVVTGNIAETKDAVRQLLDKGITPGDVIDKRHSPDGAIVKEVPSEYFS